MFPIVLPTQEESISLREVVSFNDSLKCIPDKGVGYGILKYLTEQGITETYFPAVTFNYFGDFTQGASQEDIVSEEIRDDYFAYSGYSHGNDVSIDLERDCEIGVSGQSINGILQMTIEYSTARLLEEKALNLVDRYKTHLLELIHTLEHQESQFKVPSSFTYKKLSLDQVEELEKEYGEIEDIYELSPMQNGLYYHALSDPESSAYFVQLGYKIYGNIDVQKLKDSFALILKRHAVLRTNFRNGISNDILQIERTHVVPDFRFIDISKKTKEEQDSYIVDFRKEDRQEGFNLSHGSLVRMIILRLSENEYYIVFSNHHINLDGWSTNAVLSEFEHIYESKVKGEKLELNSLNLYSSYISWLNNFDKNKAAYYWKSYLNHYDKKASLKGDTRRFEVGNYVHKDYKFNLTEQTSLKLQQIAAANKTTLNTIIQSAWGVLLSKYNNTNDVVFGLVVSGRPPFLEGVQDMVGVFINTVPQRIKYESTQSFDELLQQTQHSFIETEPYHHMNLAEVQKYCELGGDLLDHLLVFDSFLISERSVEKSTKNQTEGHVKVGKGMVEVFEQMNYDFTIIISQDNNGLFFLLKYNEVIYSDIFISSFEGQWLLLLYQI
jgi:non-ribosomal peptide synthase protein (TIGR01720 family)